MVRLVRLERTLDGFSSRCLYRWATGALVDHHGNNPCSHRLRGERIIFMLVVHGEPRWLRSTCARVKRPLPIHSALRSGSRLVALRGFDPRFPAYRAGALATRRQGKMVRLARIELAAFGVSNRRSSAELEAQMVRAENFEISTLAV